MIGSAIINMSICFYLRKIVLVSGTETQHFDPGGHENLLEDYRKALGATEDLLGTYINMTAKKLPNGLTYRTLPNNFVSIETPKNETWYITKRNEKLVSPEHAHAIFMGMEKVTEALIPVLKQLQVHCIQLRPRTVELKNYTGGKLNDIRSSKGEICGLSGLRPDKNVTILNDEPRFIVIKVPYMTRGLTVTFEGVTINNKTGSVLNNRPVSMEVGRSSVEGLVSLNLRLRNSMTSPRFAQITLKTMTFEAVEVKIDGKNDRSRAMDAIETFDLGTFIMSKIQTRVNTVLQRMGNSISREIRRRRAFRLNMAKKRKRKGKPTKKPSKKQDKAPKRKTSSKG